MYTREMRLGENSTCLPRSAVLINMYNRRIEKA